MISRQNEKPTAALFVTRRPCHFRKNIILSEQKFAALAQRSRRKGADYADRGAPRAAHPARARDGCLDDADHVPGVWNISRITTTKPRMERAAPDGSPKEARRRIRVRLLSLYERDLSQR